MEMKNPKEIVVISGKGGAGKTTITASLAAIIPGKIIVDADVDAADLYILMKPTKIRRTTFTGKGVAVIDNERCISCRRCLEICRFHAVVVNEGKYRVDELACEGCTLCRLACPVKAVTMKERIVGEWFMSVTEWGDFVYARLKPGAENSGSLVAMVKRQAKLRAQEKNIDLLLIDGPPGIGCPVISAISGVNLAIIVTEPTYSGISDLERIFQLTTHFKIKSGIVINRFDINLENTREIEAFARQNRAPVYAKIPHSECTREAISRRELPSRYCRELAEPLENLYKKIKRELEEIQYDWKIKL
jgi:MinD superfamily P-loop ATPase